MRELSVHGAVFADTELTDRTLPTDLPLVIEQGNEPIGLLADSRTEQHKYAKDQMRELDA